VDWPNLLNPDSYYWTLYWTVVAHYYCWLTDIVIVIIEPAGLLVNCGQTQLLLTQTQLLWRMTQLLLLCIDNCIVDYWPNWLLLTIVGHYWYCYWQLLLLLLLLWPIGLTQCGPIDGPKLRQWPIIDPMNPIDSGPMTQTVLLLLWPDPMTIGIIEDIIIIDNDYWPIVIGIVIIVIVNDWPNWCGHYWPVIEAIIEWPNPAPDPDGQTQTDGPLLTDIIDYCCYWNPNDWPVIVGSDGLIDWPIVIVARPDNYWWTVGPNCDSPDNPDGPLWTADPARQWRTVWWADPDIGWTMTDPDSWQYWWQPSSDPVIVGYCCWLTQLLVIVGYCYCYWLLLLLLLCWLIDPDLGYWARTSWTVDPVGRLLVVTDPVLADPIIVDSYYYWPNDWPIIIIGQLLDPVIIVVLLLLLVLVTLAQPS